MNDKIFNLYKKTLPEIIRNENAVRAILNQTDNYIISHNEDGALVGVSVIGGNVIYLLCVDDAFQKRGIGVELLKKSEEYIASKGFNKIVIGAGDDYIMPGVPMNRYAHLFFKKRGYEHVWGDEGCFDMIQDLSEFSQNEHKIGDFINGFCYRWATKKDKDGIIKCVTEAHEDFVKFYENTSDPVIIAVKDDEVIGALMVGVETEGKGVGSVGCTVTAPKFQGQGVATQMVILGTKHLKTLGLSKAFLGYTYTGILNMYGRAGYKIYLEYYMAQRKI